MPRHSSSVTTPTAHMRAMRMRDRLANSGTPLMSARIVDILLPHAWGKPVAMVFAFSYGARLCEASRFDFGIDSFSLEA